MDKTERHKLTDLDAYLMQFDGQTPIHVGTSRKKTTVRLVLQEYLAAYTAPTPEAARRAFQIGVVLALGTEFEAVGLSTDEMETLRDVLRQAKSPALILGQVVRWMESQKD